MPTLYEQQFCECRALYEEGKDAECIQLGEHNLTDWGMSKYMRIKTLCLLVGASGASDNWNQAERYRIRAEALYRSVTAQVDEANLKPDDPTLKKDREGLKDLRATLNSVCEYQAENAPENYPLEGACYPPREGRVKDHIAALLLKDATSPTIPGKQGEDDEEMQLEDVLDADMDVWMGEGDDDDIPLEIPEEVQAAEEEVFGKDQNLIEAMEKAKLDAVECDEAPEGREAKQDEMAPDGGESKRTGLRAKVAGMMKGTSKLDRKASTKSLRRQPSTMSLTKRPPWRGA